MKEDCKIIRDLLPSYIDGLTNDATNQYIEEHINDCEQCKKALEDMKKELKLDTTQKDSKEVKYIKKFNKKMKILKIILLAVLLIFILSYLRKMMILVIVNNKISEYASSINFYIKSLTHPGISEDMLIIEHYKKDDKYITKAKTITESMKVYANNYYNGETVNRYVKWDFDEEDTEHISRKTAYLNDAENVLVPTIPNWIDISNPIMFFTTPLFSSIKSDKCNDIDCYKITLYSINSSHETILYIEKETGLMIRIIGAGTSIGVDGTRYDNITDYEYKFDIVTDDDFIEPDISEYEIEE